VVSSAEEGESRKECQSSGGEEPGADGPGCSKTLVMLSGGLRPEVRFHPGERLVPAACGSGLVRNCEWMPSGSSGLCDAPQGARFHGCPHPLGSAVEVVLTGEDVRTDDARVGSPSRRAQGVACGVLREGDPMQLEHGRGSCRGEKPRHPGVITARREPRRTRRSHRFDDAMPPRDCKRMGGGRHGSGSKDAPSR
jgi:hypothetical protein